MPVTGRMTGPALEKFLGGVIDFDTDVIKMALHTNSLTPDYDTDSLQSGLGNEHAASGNYSTGGVTLSTPTITLVQDGSATAHVVSTVYEVGDIVRPASANTYVYRCIVAGTSSGSAPSWPTVIGEDVADNDITWENCGTSFVKLDSVDAQWTSSTITARYAVIYTSVGSYIVGIIDFGQDESSSNGDFNVNAHADGWFQLFLN